MNKDEIKTRHLSNKNTQMASKYMKKHSTSLTIRDMQIKAALWFHHINDNGYHEQNQETANVGRDVKRRDVYSFDGIIK